MADLNQNLAQIRELQGKPPLPSPHVIQGFEPGSPPIPGDRVVDFNPPLPPVVQQAAIEDEFLDGGPPAEGPPPSPLIPRRPRTEPQALVQPPGDPIDMIVAQVADRLLGATLGPQANPQLAVLDQKATWKGREVALSETDSRAIRAVVLKAIQREVVADLQAAGVRRVRKPKSASEQPAKRGRPRKVTP